MTAATTGLAAKALYRQDRRREASAQMSSHARAVVKESHDNIRNVI